MDSFTLLLSNQQQRVKKRPKGIYQTVAGVLLTPILEPSLSCEWHSHLKEKAFSAGGANVRWNSTMMLNDPKNNINSAVFISIFFFREHLSASNKHICFLQLFLRSNKSWKALAGAVGGKNDPIYSSLQLSNIAVVAL